MKTISIGDTLPNAIFKEKTPDGITDVTVGEIFNNKKIVLFAVPGAFTPTCHLNHLPGYLENRDIILARGIDDIVVVSVNDAFVMGAWAQSTNGTGKIRYLSDWDACFTNAIGMETDLSKGTLGKRSKRYSMIVTNRKIIALNIENSPNKASLSGAATLIKQLDVLA